MNKPTEEQIKEFWEWCGLQPPKCDIPNHMVVPPFWHCRPVELDLNNLFKYAVPKAVDIICSKNKLNRWNGYEGLFSFWMWQIRNPDSDDYALALFWAIKESL